MASNTRGRIDKRVLRLRLIERSLDYTFPQYFHESDWAIWADRIRDGESQEKAWLDKRLDESGNNPDVADWLSDDWARIGEISNGMRAALVVAIWAKIEVTLRRISRCLPSVAKQVDSSGHKLYAIRKAFLPSGIDVQRLPGYARVNAVRILNNAFKHSDGGYNPSPKYPSDSIPKWLLSKWRITSSRRSWQISYEAIPTDECVQHARRFLLALCKSVEERLPTEAGGQV